MDHRPEPIADAVRRLRKDAGLSQGALAARAGVSERSVRNIENGAIRRPRRDVMRRVADVIGLDLSVLPPAAGLRVGLLGPFVVEADGAPADVGPAKQRCLLALLALRPAVPVGNEEIVDFLWGERPPASCVNLVHTYASRLRRALETHGSDVRVESVRGGYRLTADSEALDLLRFEELASAARSGGTEGRQKYEQALDCWRGPVLSGMLGALRRHPAALAAERRRLQVALEYADVTLAEGCCDAERLHRVADAEPLHEGLHARLMLALAAGGQQAAALQVFDGIRRRLDDELGVEPGEELRDAHLRVLRNEAGRPTPTGTTKPAQLPADVAGFVGRTEDLERLDAAADRAGPMPIVSIVGAPGVGKTALAVRWAHRVAERFPDGQLYVNLRGYDAASPMTPIEALARFLRALGVRAEQVPVDEDEASALYRTLLADLKVLVVLDNASSARQIDPLLPGSPTCAVVVTSRDALTGLTAAHGARRVSLDVLQPPEAHRLLAAVIGDERASAEPEGVAALARTCGYLPLALRVVGADLDAQPHTSADAYAEDLSGAAEIAGGDAVRAAFDLSYERLDPDAQRVFRLLGVAPGPDFSTDAVAAIAGQPPADARRIAARLVAASLLQPVPGRRYRFHDLLRDYAATRAGDASAPTERSAAMARLYDLYLSAADSACRTLYPGEYRLTRVAESASASQLPPFSGPEDALDWLDRERANLRDAIIAAPSLDLPEFSWRLVDALRGYLWGRGCGTDMLSACQAAVRVAKHSGDRVAEASMLDVLGIIHYNHSEYDRAAECHSTARDLNFGLGDRRAEAYSLHQLGQAFAQSGRTREQLRCHQRALELSQLEDDQEGQARDLKCLGSALETLARHEEAQTAAEQALEISRRLGDPIQEARVLHMIGVVRHSIGDPAGAVELYVETLRLARSLGLRHGEAAASICLADSYIDLGQYAEAERFASLGGAVGRSIGERRQEVAGHFLMAVVHERCGRFAEARPLFMQALDLADKITYPYGRVCALLGLARLERRSGRPVQAIALCRDAWDTLSNAGLRHLEVPALVESAWCHYAGSELADAASLGNQALSNATERGQRLLAAKARHVLGVIRSAAGVGSPEPYLREAREVFAEIGAPEVDEIDRLKLSGSLDASSP